MTTQFPNGLDSFQNPLSDSLLSQPSVDHSDQHSHMNDAMEAVQAKIGIEGSTDVFSLEYRLNTIEQIAGSVVVIQNTSTLWYSTNPVLESYQVGVETDTLKLKIGTGAHWVDIPYATITPAGLENSLGDYIPIGDRGNPGGVASLDSSGLIPDSEIPSTIARDSEISTHSNLTTNIHGISDTSALATKTYADATKTYADNSVSTHSSDTTNIHGIADTANLITTSGGTVQNLTVTNNLTVQGTTTTVNSTNLEVTDSLIYLASEQFDTDVLDIGIFGAYGDLGAGHKHTGLVRDASDSKWKLVSNASEPTDSELDFTGVTYDTLKVGGLEVGSVSNTEIGYLDGVTSSIQTQLNAKSDSLIQFNQQSSSYTIQLSDLDKVVEMSNGGTITIPAEATLNLPVGFSVEILQTGSSQVTIAGDGFTPNATPGLKLRTQWSSASIIKRGSDIWVISGDLSA